MSSKAAEDGSSLLSSYRKEKFKSNTRMNDDDSDALSDGSFLAFKFLESKGGSGGGDGGESPVELIRLAAVHIERLQIRPEDEEIVEEIRGLLQAAEEGVIERLGDNMGKSRIDDSFLRKYDISRDLNDADMDQYEEIVNDLADKLEKMNAEKSDLQLISTALGERLQRLSKEKDDALQLATASFEKEKKGFQSKIADLESQVKKLEEVRFDYSLDANESILDPSLAPQRKILEQYMKNQLDLNAEEIEQYENMINSLIKKIDSNEAENATLNQTCEDLRQQLLLSVSKSDCDAMRSALIDYCQSLESFVTSVVSVLSVDFEQTSLPQPSTQSSFKWDKTALASLLLRLQGARLTVLSHSVSKVDFDKIEIRLEAKLAQLEDQAQEINRLQAALDRAEKELDQFKMHEMKSVATHRLEQLDKDNELEMLRSKVMDLEEKEAALENEVELLERRLAQEIEKFNSLATVLDRLQAKESATEELLVELQDKCRLLLDENDELHQELAAVDLARESNQREKSSKDQHAAHLENIRQNWEEKAQELTRVIEQQAVLLSEANTNSTQQKSELLESRQRAKELELELQDTRRIVAHNEHHLRPVLEQVAHQALHMNHTMNVFCQEGLEALLRHLEMKLSAAESGVQDLRIHLKGSHGRESLVNSEELKSRMVETQRALALALARHDEDDAEKENLRAQVLQLDEELQQMRAIHLQDLSVAPHLREQEEHILRLKRLLAAAERRVSSSAADQAQKFAQSARIIGYLESECFRLHGLCDYFKVANAKLTGELKKALTYSIRQQHSENITLTVIEQKDDLQSQLEQQTIALSQLRREHANELRRTEDDCREQLLKLNADLESMFTQLAIKETETAELQSALRSAQSQYSNIERSLREEVAQLKVNFTESEKRRISQARELSEKDSELSELLGKLREASMQMTQLDERQKLLLQDAEARQALDEQSKVDLIHELQETKQKLEDTESRLSVTQAKLTAREEALSQQEAQLADHVLRASMLSDENSGLLESVQLLKQQVQLAVQERDTSLEETQAATHQQQRLQAQVDKLTASLTQRETHCREFEVTILELKEEIEKFSASVSALEMREKFNSDELNNASQVIGELRLEVEALRSLLDTTQSDRQDLHTTLTQHQVVVTQLENALAQSQEEHKLIDEKWKKSKKEAAEAREKLVAAEESLEMWLQLRLRLVDQWHGMLVSWEQTNALSAPGLRTEQQLQRLRELLQRLLPLPNATAHHVNGNGEEAVSVIVTDNNAPVASDWLQCMHEMQDIVYSALVSGRNQSEELRIKLNNALLQQTAVEQSLSTCQNELRVLGDLQVKCQRLEEQRQQLQQEAETGSMKLQELSVIQQSLAQRVASARMRISGLAADTGVSLPASIIQRSTDAVSLDMDSFHRDLTDFEDTVVSMVSFLENRSNELRSIVMDLEEEHQAAMQRLQREVSQRDEEAARLQQLLERQDSETQRLQQMLGNLSRELDCVATENETLRLSETQLQNEVLQLNETLEQTEECVSQLQRERDELLRLSSTNGQELHALESELDLFRRRLQACELQLENVSGSSQRLKAERDALESLNLSMKLELERVRLSQTALQQSKTLCDTLPHLFVEFDRLLIATDGVLLQIAIDGDADVTQTQADASETQSTVVSLKGVAGVSETGLVAKIQQYGSKVSRTVTALHKLTVTHREEKKKLRHSEEQQVKLKTEISAQKEALSQLQIDLRQRNEELAQLLQTQPRSSQELERLEQTVKTLEKEVKDSRSQLAETHRLLDAQQKSASRLQLEVAAKSDEVASLRRQLAALKQSLQLEATQRESEASKHLRSGEERESLALQLDACRQNVDKLNSSVRHLEASVTQERGMRHTAEARVAEMSASFSRLQQIDTTLQASVKECETLSAENETLRETQTQLQDKVKLLQSELELSRRKTQSLETRLQSVLGDRDAFLQKIAETQAKMHQANMVSVRSQNNNNNTTNSNTHPVESQNNTNNVKITMAMSTVDETRDLKQLIEALRTELEEKEAKLLLEKKKKASFEKEMEAMRQSQSKIQEDCERLRSYSVAFRSEGREVRREVLELCGCVCEMTVQMRMDLQLSPATKQLFSLSLEDKRDTGYLIDGFASSFADAKQSDHSQQLKLTEALGVQELLGAMKHLRETFGMLREEWRRLRQKEDDLTVVDVEVSRLRRQLEEHETQRKMQTARHSEELRYWQQKYTELQTLSSATVQQKKRVIELEKILSQEQALKTEALAEVEQLRAQVERLQGHANRALAVSLSDSHSGHQIQQIQLLQTELQQLRQQLAVIGEGNVALQATVQHLEDRLLAQTQSQLTSAGHSNGVVDGNAASKQLQATDVVLDIYRSMLFSFVSAVALLPPETQTQAVHTQYEAALQTTEQLVHALRKYYDEELDFLSNKLNSLFQQYREAKVYGTELSRQLEDQVKALFRSGKSSISEFMMKEREKLKLEVERVQQDLLETEQQLLEDQEKMRAKMSRMTLDIVQLVKDRDEAAACLAAIENFCLSRGVDISTIAAHQKLSQRFWRPASDQSRNSRSDMAAKKTIDTLMRGLLEADQELLEAEKRAKRSSVRVVREETRKGGTLSETFLTRSAAAPSGTVFDLQTMDKGRGSSSLRISKSKR